jgi:hypothetical protein
MAWMCPEAEKYSYISWRPITHLFWGKYPYKVETIYPARGFRTTPAAYNLVRKIFLGAIVNTDRLRYQRVIAKFRKTCERHVPDDRACWKSLETETAFHFYFVHRADMLRFVAGNAHKVRVVHEPVTTADVTRLAGTTNTYLRATRFFDTYSYRVLFRGLTAEVTEELDGWVLALFGRSGEQAKYNAFGKRCLYLSNENDILLTRLAFSQYILRVEQVILRSDDYHASDVGEKTGGKGRDSPVH